jgi:transcriptional regulator with XRE-family HTH domain
MSTDPKAIFPKALQYYMSLNGKKQQDLIRDLGISSPTISQWINGKMFPRMDKVEMLANYFNIHTTDLLTDPYEKHEQPSSDPAIMVKLLESNPALYELFKTVVKLEDTDIVLLKGIAQRLIELQGGEP